MLTFTVWGVAQPKGSAKAFVPKGWTRPVVTSDNTKNKGWQQLVAAAATHALDARSEARELLTAGVRLSVAFHLPRPKKYLAPRHVDVPHLTKPDLDKLVRSCKDALTKVVWQDDSQVIEVHATKAYVWIGGLPHVDITVEPTR